jgi:hypothetical protein
MDKSWIGGAAGSPSAWNIATNWRSGTA